MDLIKTELTSSKVLAHYNPSLPLTLATDASSYGIAAILSHEFPNGDSRSIAYASRTLSPSEKNYSQIDKESLAIVYGVKKFHQYSFGISFLLITDHKPLVTIFGYKKGIPIFAASRLQRWSVILSTYQYKIKFVNSDKNDNADCLSRLPCKSYCKVEDNDNDIGHISYLQENLPIDYKTIVNKMQSDNTLNKLYYYILHGWPETGDIPKELKIYENKFDQLHVEK